MQIKLKSFLGKAALEELNEQAAAADAAQPTESDLPDEDAKPVVKEGEGVPAEPEVPAAAEPAVPSAVDLPEATDKEKAKAEDGGEVVETVQEEADEQIADSVADELAQADAGEEVVAEVAEDSEELAAATEALIDTVLLINQANQNGGMDRFAAMSVRQSTQYITSRLGLESLPLPAMEDMETPSAKVGAGSAAVKQIVAFIKRIMDAIAAGFSRFKDWIVTLVKGLFNAWASIETRANKIAAQAGSTKNAPNDKLSGKNALGFYFGVDVASNVSSETDKFIKTVEFFNNPTNYKSWTNAVGKLVAAANGGDAAQGYEAEVNSELQAFSTSILKTTTENVSDELLRLMSQGADKHSKDKHKVGSGYIFAPGGNVVLVSIPVQVESIGFLSATTTDTSEAINKKAEIARLPANEVVTVCTKIAEFAKKMQADLKSNSGGIREIEKVASNHSKDLIAANKKIIESIINEATEGKPEFARKLANTIAKVGVKTSQIPIYAVNKAAVKGMAALLTSCAASIGGGAKDDASATASKTNDKKA